MKRLAFVCADPGVPVFGYKACSIHVQEVIRAFRKLGLEVVLITSRSGGAPPSDLVDVEIYELLLGSE
jgi:hypothetical protein